jgi:linoleate 8R-lipoxygenase / 9,12-octadecadienoate 8-hydroperoxide 8R-isomerase
MAADNMGRPSRDDVNRAFSQISQVIHAALRPLPNQTGDYTYLPDPPKEDCVLGDLSELKFKDIGIVQELLRQVASGEPIEDKQYIMERVVRLASQLPLASRIGIGLTNSLLTQLWNDLQHPPRTYLDEETVYRKADGSFNNVMWPHLGAAGTPYARSVKPETVTPIALPDPGVVFDSLMVRKDFKEHPNKISSVLFYLASIIIHDLFRTSHTDFNMSETSSYLDLAPLYGSNQDEQNLMRTFKDGRIKPDCFSEKRILGFPPGVGVLLIMFNRFHNYVVEQLANIDENGRFSKLRHSRGQANDKEADTNYDNTLFQTGRLITCGMYINCILKDYVRTILNLNRTNSTWDLDPRSADGRAVFGLGAGQATGNQVSAEFNLVYRWHSCVSKNDEQWTLDAFGQMFSGVDSQDPSVLINKMSQWAQSLPANPQARPFAKLKRTAAGTFDDGDLSAIFAASVEDAAGAYGPNQVPEILRGVEVLGIIQARSWNLATLNEFRQFFGLVPHKTFEDINPDPYVSEQLKRLYDHPDFVELYPGIVVEEPKESQVPGSGLCPGFTISRAVLSDAVALVRGDRFYTDDFTAKNLTNFGFNEVAYDLNVDCGHVFYKLVLRAFPRHFEQNSVYAHFPLVIPSENQKILISLNLAEAYNFQRPSVRPEMTIIQSYAANRTVLINKWDFNVTWGVDSIEFLAQHDKHNYGKNFMLAGDGPENMKSRELMESALYCPKWTEEIKSFYEQITTQLLKEKAYQVAGAQQIDVVRDVSNCAQVHFAASVFSLPLKTEQNPHGIYSESELYAILVSPSIL